MRYISLFILVFYLLACSSGSEDIPIVEGDLHVEWEVKKSAPGQDSASFILINTGELPIDQNWNIYFNQLGAATSAAFAQKSAQIERINGYFYVLKPTKGFEVIQPGDTSVLTYALPGPVGRKSFQPEGMYYIVGDNDPVPIDEQHIRYYEEGLPESLEGISPEDRFKKNEWLKELPVEDFLPIIPEPAYFAYDGDTLKLDQVKINYQNGLEKEADHLGMRLSRFFSGPIQLAPGNLQADIFLVIDSAMRGNGSYHLIVNENGARIKANDKQGIFYGIQSLISLLILADDKSDQVVLRHSLVSDFPRYSYRGLHIDMARNFKSYESLKRIIDIMSYYKLNKLNLQLADDEGWRLEIPSLPELHEIGGLRGHTDTERDRIHPAYGSGPFTENQKRGGSGWYSKEEFIDILKYARDRHIEVIPKLDFPGHARAAIKAMESRYYNLLESGSDKSYASTYLLSDIEDKSDYRSVQGYDDNVICVCRESVYDFLELVVDDIIAMYNDAGVPITMIHLGGDEVPEGVWLGSDFCRDMIEENNWEDPKNDLSGYFIKRANEILSKRGLITSGWEEFASIESEEGLIPNPEFVDQRIVPFVWHMEYAYPLANAGYKLILSNSNSLYFDLAYEQDVYEPGLTWAGYVGLREPYDLDPLRLDVDDNLKKPENILGLQAQLWGETIWDDQRLEYYLLPKLHSFATRAWSREPEWAGATGKRRDRIYKREWNRFVNTIAKKEFSRLELLVENVTIRLPRPGAEIRLGMLYANTEMPGLDIRYTTDGSEPKYNSKLYTGPVEIQGTVKLKSFFKNNQSFTTTISSDNSDGQAN